MEELKPEPSISTFIIMIIMIIIIIIIIKMIIIMITTGVALTFEKLRIANAQHGTN